MIAPSRRAVDLGVVEQVVQRAAQRVGLPGDGDGRRLADAHALATGRRVGRELVEAHDAVGCGPRVLALEREKVVDEPLEAAGVELEVGHHLRVGPVTGKELDVAREGGERRAQLVAGVGEEAPLAPPRRLERLEHAVERVRELRHLVLGRRVGQAPRRVAGLLDLRRGGGEAGERAEAAPGQERGAERAERRREQRREEQQRP